MRRKAQFIHPRKADAFLRTTSSASFLGTFPIKGKAHNSRTERLPPWVGKLSPIGD